jgi:hypothetical protein
MFFLLLNIRFTVPITYMYIINSDAYRELGVRIMVFSANFNNISVISLRSVLSVVETGENRDIQ